MLRQRQNIDLVVAPGIEAKAEWQVASSVHYASGLHLFTQPTIEEAADASLEGKLLAQTPEHVVTAQVEWTPVARWHLTGQVRHSGRQFEDDQNSRALAAFTTVDLAAIYDFSTHASAALRIENVFDEEIETGKSATGLVSISAPRLVTLSPALAL